MEIKDFEVQSNENVERRLKAYAEGMKELGEKNAAKDRLTAYAEGISKLNDNTDDKETK